MFWYFLLNCSGKDIQYHFEQKWQEWEARSQGIIICWWSNTIFKLSFLYYCFSLIELGGLLCNFPSKFAMFLLGSQYWKHMQSCIFCGFVDCWSLVMELGHLCLGHQVCGRIWNLPIFQRTLHSETIWVFHQDISLPW